MPPTVNIHQLTRHGHEATQWLHGFEWRAVFKILVRRKLLWIILPIKNIYINLFLLKLQKAFKKNICNYAKTSQDSPKQNDT